VTTGIAILKKYIADVKAEKGNFLLVSIAEAFVFFCASFGFSDFVLNTAIFKKSGWVDDARLPGSLITAYIVPGFFIALTYVTGGIEVDFKCMAICVAVELLGSIIGSRVAVKINADVIKKIIGFAMIFSMLALVIKLIVSSGVAGYATGLSGWQYAVALPIIFVMGILNMMGVGLKPPLMSMFLLMGLSPLATLTILMVMAVFGPVAGSISFFSSGKYQKKVFVCSAIFGSIAAMLGGLFALTINPMVLTVTMIVAMAYVSWAMLRT